MSEIRTRKYNKGDKNESSWPSEFGNAKKSCKYVFRDGKFQEVGADFRETKRAHAVHQDSMDPIEHPAEPGKKIDSKSRFRAITKKHGLEEMGNDRVKLEPVRKGMSEADYVDAVKKAINDCRYGNSGLTEFEREKCRRIDRLRNNHG